MRDQRVELLARIAQHVQHRAEHLAPQLGDRLRSRSCVGGTKVPRRGSPAAPLASPRGPSARIASMWSSEPLLRLRGDHRADIGRQPRPDRRRAARPSRPSASPGRGRRCPPAGRACAAPSSAGRRGRRPRPARRHHLLGQRRGIDDHRVLPAGLGDQRQRRAVGVSRSASCLVDRARATSVEPVNTTPCDRRVARPAARRPRRRRAASCSTLGAARRLRAAARTACGGDQRRLLGRLGDAPHCRPPARRRSGR